MKRYIVVLLVILNSSNISSQCTIENEIGGCNGQCVNNNIIGGQSFMACETGELEEISLCFTNSGPTRQFVLRFYDGIGFNNLFWTTNVFTVTSAAPIIYDLSNGTGSNNVVANNMYSYSIESVGSSLIFNKFECDIANDSYPDGTRLNCNGTPLPNHDVNFKLAINGASLPVDYIEFTGRVNNKLIELSWSTASEINNLGFEIQKSKDGKDWQLIDFVEGQGTSNEINEYKYEDLNPSSEIIYYRLKQIDYDGAFEYSKVIALIYDNFESSIEIFPNPSNGKLVISGVETANVKIIDKMGKLVKEIITENQNIDISELSEGLYFVNIRFKEVVITKRIIIEK